MTSVKVFSNTLSGAPVLSGTAGSLATILKACLVDGFGLTSVVSLSVTANVATATFAAGHSFAPGSVALFTGATPAGLNGLKPVLTASINAITFAAPGVPDGAATGSITAKLAPAGWTELYPGTTNVIALKPSVLEATGCVLRVDDTGTKNARVRAYESMSDIATGLGSTPLDAQVNGGLYWPKSHEANAVMKNWWLVADERGFYLATAPITQAYPASFEVLYAGDIASFKSGDAYGYLLTGNLSDQTVMGSTWAADGCVAYSRRTTVAGAYLVRSHLALGGAVNARCVGAHHTGVTQDIYAGASGYAFGSFPNGPNNGLMVAPVEVIDSAIRGLLPGLLHPVQNLGSTFAPGAIVDGTDDLAGRRLLALRVGPSNNSTIGTVFFDTTGPWSR